MLHKAEGPLPHRKSRRTSRKSEIRKQLKEYMQTEFRNLYRIGNRARTTDVVAIFRSDYP